MMAKTIHKRASQEIETFKRDGLRSDQVFRTMVPKEIRWRFVKALIIGLMVIERIEDEKCDVIINHKTNFKIPSYDGP